MDTVCKKTLAIEIVQTVVKNKENFLAEQISAGLSGSELFRVKGSGLSYVVRFWNLKWIDYFPQDLACQLIASDAGYGPQVIFSDAEKCITVMEYCQPEVLPNPEKKIGALVDLLKKMHAGPEVPLGWDRRVYLDELLEETKKIPQSIDLEVLKAVKEAVFAATRPTALKLACHRDLHHGNLIFNQGRFLAIDYTWGAMDDPFTDLANVALFHCVDEKEEQMLLEQYLERTPNANEQARFSLMKVPARLFYGLEFLGQAYAMMQHVIMPHGTSKKYIHFGDHKNPASNPTDLFEFAYSLLTEIIDYSKTERYLQDISLLRS